MFGRAPQRNNRQTVGMYAERLDGCAWEGAVD
jgi:hypothetical protein